MGNTGIFAFVLRASLSDGSNIRQNHLSKYFLAKLHKARINICCCSKGKTKYIFFHCHYITIYDRPYMKFNEINDKYQSHGQTFMTAYGHPLFLCIMVFIVIKILMKSRFTRICKYGHRARIINTLFYHISCIFVLDTFRRFVA